MKIALVAQHSTPVATDAATATAGDDARLVEMSKSLAGEGHQVTVYARRSGKALPPRARLAPGVSVEYVGPADPGGDDSRLVAHLGAFSAPLHAAWANDRPDVVHAVRWTSGLAALAAARDLHVPVVQTFDQLGVTERRHGLTGAGPAPSGSASSPPSAAPSTPSSPAATTKRPTSPASASPAATSASSRPASTPPSSPPTAQPTAATTGTASSPSPT